MAYKHWSNRCPYIPVADTFAIQKLINNIQDKLREKLLDLDLLQGPCL